MTTESAHGADEARSRGTVALRGQLPVGMARTSSRSSRSTRLANVEGSAAKDKFEVVD
jgi:hypothetical protein